LVEDSISKNKTNTNKELTTEVIQEIPPKNITNNNKTKTETNLTDLNFDMVYVRGGTFTMGSNEGDADEKPTHQVTLSDFYIGKYEVTQKQWKALMGTNPSEFKGDNLPVEKVSWNDVQEFIKKLNAKTGKKYSLPTEAQWEYAAGGGANNRTKWAGTNSESSVGTYIWYDGNSGNKTYPIGTKNPNQLGIYDMSGNVWEWCLDWYGNYSSDSQTNTKGAQSGTHRIGRGGGWGDYNPYCRVTNRSKGIPTNTINDLGFRIVFIP